jgi:hypothetical protein
MELELPDLRVFGRHSLDRLRLSVSPPTRKGAALGSAGGVSYGKLEGLIFG